MKSKKIVWIVSIIISVGIVIPFVYQIISKTVKPQSLIIQAVVTLQKAIEDKDIEKIWRSRGKIKEIITDPISEYYDKFKKNHQKWFQEEPQEVRAYINARLGKIRVITPNRAWVECSSYADWLKGFYMVKENGEWKYVKIPRYLNAINEHIKLLNEAIKKYYADKNYLPYSVSELVPDYIESLPLDPFRDDEKSYTYETLGETSWRLYSIGIDARDDFGVIKYDPETNDFGIGDITREDRIE